MLGLLGLADRKQFWLAGSHANLSTGMSHHPVCRSAAPARLAFALQVLFRSLHRLLMDTAAHEYLFCQVG